MSSLSYTQRLILSSLIRLFRASGRPVKSGEIAKVVGRDDGTIRNVMSALKPMNVVEGTAGPMGGYAPTVKAYRLLMMSEGKKLKETPIHVTGHKRVNGVVLSMNILNLPSPPGMAMIQLLGEIEEIRIGDQVKIGPTPAGKLTIIGTVVSIDKNTRSVLMKLHKIVEFPDLPIGRIATKKLATLKSNDSIRKAAKLLYSNNIRAAPVTSEKGKLLGMVSTREVAKAVSQRKENGKVKEIADYPIYTVVPSVPLSKVVQMMSRERLTRVLLVNKQNKPVGIVTSSDIIKWISSTEIA